MNRENTSDLAMTLVAEYDFCAEWCARRGIAGNIGDELPRNISSDVHKAINADVEAFQQRIREMAYWVASNRRPSPNRVEAQP